MVGRFFGFIQSQSKKSIARVGLFTLAVTVVSYWVSFQDRAASRQDSAWTTLRAAIVWTQENEKHWGNVGQIAAIQTLTSNCGSWWRGTSFEGMLDTVFPNCVDLNSLSLERMELGRLKAVGANLSHSDFACTNLAVANLRKANLDGAGFLGANLAGADLGGAKLTGDVDLRLANVSWVQFNSDEDVNLKALKCACMTVQPYRLMHDEKSLPPKIFAILSRLNACPQGNTCEPEVVNDWKCIE
jgi:hypothetical protein